VSAHRLLVVDDNPEVCEVIRVALEWAGYEVDCASNGPEALARLQASRYELALIDCRLPGGICTAEIAEQAMLTESAVVLMSGDLESIDLPDRLPYPCLRKPFRISALLAIIKQALDEPTTA
jgi:CheY-like chemotaxis protein